MIFIFYKSCMENNSKNKFYGLHALVATAKKRGTLDLIEAEDIREIFDEIESSPVMETLWKTYQKNYSYAADISWHTIKKSICALYGSILENMYDA